MSDHWKTSHTIGCFAIIIAIVLVGLLPPPGSPDARLWAWIMTLALLLAFTYTVSNGITGLWRGALIDERNRMSLARLQLVLWTLLILSAFLTAALSNVRATDVPDPLAIAIPIDLWILMGISTTSLVASPLLKRNKTATEPDEKEKERTLNQLEKQGTDRNEVVTHGVLVTNTTPAAAQWADLFKGEETGNAALLDVAKLQMFYFTLIVVIAYAVNLGTMMKSAKPVTSFPDLSEGLIALLGISHAGYLSSKAVTHSTTT